VGQGRYFVVEGDEYDTAYFDKTPKFFKYRPTTLIFTSLEYDHADIYPDLDAIREQFAKLLGGLPSAGRVVACVDDPNVAALLAQAVCPVIPYGFSDAAQCQVTQWAPDGAGARFVTRWQGASQAWRVPMAGGYNTQNATAVLVAAQHLGLAVPAIQRAFDSFQGVKRRQEVRGEVNRIVVIDDFAHHPTAIGATIAAMRQRYPRRRLWAVFEPRSFTARGAVFRDQFPAAFLGADRAVIAPAFQSGYSAGVERLDSGQVAEAIRARGRAADAPESTQAIVDLVTAQAAPGDVVLVMSNGGFEGLIDRLLTALTQRHGPSPRSATA
jgi:UDP-N-acetylmuramate: L-alanyl-gamma-D-glutamyl-meso-diaminopimelate ligase